MVYFQFSIVSPTLLSFIIFFNEIESETLSDLEQKKSFYWKLKEKMNSYHIAFQEDDEFVKESTNVDLVLEKIKKMKSSKVGYQWLFWVLIWGRWCKLIKYLMIEK